MSKYEGHTEGPWVLFREDVIFGSKDECVAVAFSAGPDARLIADAPMLLKQRDILLAAMKRIENLHISKMRDQAGGIAALAMIQCEELEK